MNISDQLDKAADIIEEHGWTTGEDGWTNGAGNGYCLEGAIFAAAGHKFTQPSCYDAVAAKASALTESCPLYAVVHEYLLRRDLRRDRRDRQLYGARLCAWNDEFGESQANIVAILRAVALIQKAREHEREAVNA